MGEDQALDCEGLARRSLVVASRLVASRLDSFIHASYDSATMTAATIEQRIAALEKEVRQLRAAAKKKVKKEEPWWERFGGMFKDDPLFDEMVKAGEKYRKSLRPRRK